MAPFSALLILAVLLILPHVSISTGTEDTDADEDADIIRQYVDGLRVGRYSLRLLYAYVTALLHEDYCYGVIGSYNCMYSRVYNRYILYDPVLYSTYRRYYDSHCGFSWSRRRYLWSHEPEILLYIVSLHEPSYAKTSYGSLTEIPAVSRSGFENLSASFSLQDIWDPAEYHNLVGGSVFLSVHNSRDDYSANFAPCLKECTSIGHPLVVVSSRADPVHLEFVFKFSDIGDKLIFLVDWYMTYEPSVIKRGQYGMLAMEQLVLEKMDLDNDFGMSQHTQPRDEPVWVWKPTHHKIYILQSNFFHKLTVITNDVIISLVLLQILLKVFYFMMQILEMQILISLQTQFLRYGNPAIIYDV